VDGPKDRDSVSPSGEPDRDDRRRHRDGDEAGGRGLRAEPGRAESTFRTLRALGLLADELDRSHPGAAASLREGIDETLTLTRLGIRGKLKQTLGSTNPCESMIESVRRSSRNVKRWSSGDMALRWTAAGVLEAERQFRRVIGYRDLAKLATAIEREVAQTIAPIPKEEAATLQRGAPTRSGGAARCGEAAGGEPRFGGCPARRGTWRRRSGCDGQAGTRSRSSGGRSPDC